MSEDTEQIRQKLIRRRLRRIAIVLSIPVLIYAYFYLTLESNRSQEEEISELSPEQAQRGEISIGLLAPLRGQYAAYGESIVRGAKLAVKKINTSGGLLGKNVKLLTADTRSDPNLAAELAEDLVRRAKVPLIIGTAAEETALAASFSASQGQTPFIYLGNGHLKTCSRENSQKLNPYVFGTGFTEHMSVEPFLIYLADKLRQAESRFRIYYFGTSDEAALKDSEFTRVTAESLGFETVAEEVVDGRITDYFRKIRAIFKLDPDVLIVSTSKSTSPGFLKQVAKLGVKVEMAVAGIKPFESELVAPLGDSLDEFYTVSGYAEDIDSETNRSFLEAWRKDYPTDQASDIAVAGAYTALLLAKEAFEKAGSTDTDAFLEAMKSVEVKAPQGTVSVNSHNNTLVKPLYATRFKEGKYSVDEFLGDVSHPSLEACAVPGLEE